MFEVRGTQMWPDWGRVVARLWRGRRGRSHKLCQQTDEWGRIHAPIYRQIMEPAGPERRFELPTVLGCPDPNAAGGSGHGQETKVPRSAKTCSVRHQSRLAATFPQSSICRARIRSYSLVSARLWDSLRSRMTPLIAVFAFVTFSGVDSASSNAFFVAILFVMMKNETKSRTS